MRLVLAHDWLVGMRGGERVLDRLARIAVDYSGEPAPLYLLVDNGKPHTPAIDVCPKRTSLLQHLPGSTGRLRRWYLPLFPMAVDRLVVEPCDLLISSSSAAIKGIKPPPGARHICYCHTPARYIWSRTSHYGNGVKRFGLELVRNRFRKWDRNTSTTVDKFIANSSHTASEIFRCFGRESTIIHPPVRTDFFTPDAAVHRTDAFVIVSALEPYKRIDIAIRAANACKLPLLIAGEGSQKNQLSRLAGPTVTMLGRVPEDKVRHLYRMAKAFVFPALEDFGIAPVEAMACGTPVIAYRAGGALDTVTAETGTFFTAQTAGSLAEAMLNFNPVHFRPNRIRQHAEQFSTSNFDTRMRTVIESVINDREQNQPPHSELPEKANVVLTSDR